MGLNIKFLLVLLSKVKLMVQILVVKMLHLIYIIYFKK